MGERIAVMRAGQIHQVADPLTIYHRPVDRFVASFIGSPSMNLFEGRLNGSAASLRFESDGVSLAIPAPWSQQLAAHAGEAVALGVRPEHLAPMPPGEKGDLVMTLEVLEPTGSESFLSGPVGGVPVVSRGPADVHYEPGTPVGLHLAFEKAHWFGGTGDRNLLHAGGTPRA